MANFYQAYNRAVAIGEVFDFAAYGKYVSILTWNNAVDLMISIEGQSFFPIKAGMSIKLPDTDKAFFSLRFQNLTGVVMVLEFALSDGAVIDNRFNAVGIINVIVPGITPVTGYGLVPCLAAPGGTQIAALNVARRSILIQNLIGNLGNMMIGFDAALTAVNYGVLLVPGAIYTTTDYTGAIFSQATVNLENVNFIEI